MVRIRLPILLSLSLAVILAGCGSSRNTPLVTRPAGDIDILTPPSVETLVSRAEDARGDESDALLLDAVELLLEEQSYARAGNLLARISRPGDLPADLQARFALASARHALPSGNAPMAIEWLSGELIDESAGLDPALLQQIWLLRASAYLENGQPLEAISDLGRVLGADSASGLATARNQLWEALETLDTPQLDSLASAAGSYEMRGWIELARQMRAQQHSIKSQIDALGRWRTIWARHPGARELPDHLLALERIWAQRPRQIALLLPMQDQIGIAVQEGFLGAYYEALGEDDEVPRITVYDTSPLLRPDASLDINGRYDTAVADGAELIVGPLDKTLVRQLHTQTNLPVPTLALNYSDLPGRNSPNFFQFGLAPEDEIRQTAGLAWQSGHRRAAIVSPGGQDYLRLADSFSSHWSALGGEVVTRATFGSESEYADIIKRLLGIDASEARAARIISLLPRSGIEFVPRRRQDIDFIFLMANPRQGRQIKPTLAFYFAGDIPVYALSAIYDGLENPLADRDLNGIVFTDTPWVLRNDDPLKQQMSNNLRQAQGPFQRLRALGVDSFRLYPRLSQLASGQLLEFEGATGVLTMSPTGAIQRQPESAVFANGLVRLSGAGELAAGSGP